MIRLAKDIVATMIVVSFIIGGLCATISLTIDILKPSYKTEVTYQDIYNKVPASAVILHNSALYGMEEGARFVKDISKMSFKRNIDIFITSTGGDLRTVNFIMDQMLVAKGYGHSFTCYVDKAYSAAFYILSVCDKRIGLKGSKYLTHFVHNGKGKSDNSRKLLTINMCTTEAAFLKLSADEWCKKSRVEGENIIFSDKQALEEGIIHQII